MKGEIPPNIIIAKLENLCHKLKLFDLLPMKDSRKKPQIPIIHIYDVNFEIERQRDFSRNIEL
jgi:hypothetical protein